MFQNPTLFPQISNREGWLQTLQIYDDDTGDLIALADSSGIALYGVTLEIRPPRRNGSGGYGGYGETYGSGSCEAIIYGVIEQGANALTGGTYISIVDSGTIQIQIPKSVMRTLRLQETYDVFLAIDDPADDDGRQLLIGKLPVFYGGRT